MCIRPCDDDDDDDAAAAAAAAARFFRSISATAANDECKYDTANDSPTATATKLKIEQERTIYSRTYLNILYLDAIFVEIGRAHV